MSETQIDLNDISIQAWDVDIPQPAPDNHKNHTAESVARLAKSMADIGQIQAIMVDKDCEIIAGHGRLLAAKSLGWAKIKVVQVPIDRATAIKARIADNLMSNQDIDQSALNRELGKLIDILGEFDIETMIADPVLGDLTKMNLEMEIDENSISENPLEDAERMADEGESIINSAAEGEVKIAKVFGFNSVSATQAISIKDFLAAIIDERPEEDPAAAVVAWMEENQP